jgi:hypothetical protein
MQTTIFKNENKVSTDEVLKIFNKELKESFTVKKSEIEELTDIMAKNPVDKFIITEKPTNPVMQGDILIWSEETNEYKENFPLVKDLQATTRLVLQDDDSLTGDHELVPLKGAKFTLKTGKFVPPLLKDHFWGSNTYDCKILEIDSPFVIKHREHGNITFLSKGKYMICSSLDSETLTRMRD